MDPSPEPQRCPQCARLLTADNTAMAEDQPKQAEQLPREQGERKDHHKVPPLKRELPAPKREPCVLSDVGLPLRPGKQICWHYENLGLCKYGRACAFDHPVKESSSSAEQGSTTQSDPSKK